MELINEQERQNKLNELLNEVLQMTDEEVNKYIDALKLSEENKEENDGSSDELSRSVSIYDHHPHDYRAVETIVDENAAFEKHGNEYSWKRAPQVILVSFKPNDEYAEKIAHQIIQELKNCKISVIVDPVVAQKMGCAAYTKNQLSPSVIDLVFVIGGDGSLIYISSLFPEKTPPIVAFNAGSLGFLAPFETTNIQTVIQFLFSGPLTVVPRQRIHAYVQKHRAKIHSNHQNAQSSLNSPQMSSFLRNVDKPCQQEVTPHKHVAKFNPLVSQKVHSVINEIYINRGYSNYLTNLQCYSNGYYFGTIQADGLMISTPTGSTAYALSAGGVPVFPQVDCFLFTPVCPHVMSSKQLILNSQGVLKVKMSMQSRGNNTVCFDGRDNIEICPGDSVVIAKSPFDLNTVCLKTEGVDWFAGLKRCLNWNVRTEQKALGPQVAVHKQLEVGDLDSELD